MNSKVIDGKALAAHFKKEIAERAEKFSVGKGRKVGLAVVLVGEDPASKIYVRNKIKACADTGIESFSYILKDTATETEVCRLVDELNSDERIDGILVQLPLPKHIDERTVLSRIIPKKDVDGFHAVNVGNLFLGNECLAACTPSGIIELIKSTGTEIAGKHAVVIGRSNIVGKPAALLLLNNNATVTVCHSKTVNLKEITRSADILVVAVGKKNFVTGDMVKSGAVVIDVGMNRDDSGLYGDVDFESVEKKAAFITPVPGGVGPMTITMLLKNTIEAAGA